MRFIFNVARDKTLASTAHFLVPQKRKAALSPAAYTYLRAVGAFDLETPELRSELIHLFFQYVYPTLPVIEPIDFLHRYETGGPACVNPLLLQSMFLAASSVREKPLGQTSTYPVSIVHFQRRITEVRNTFRHCSPEQILSEGEGRSR